MTAHGPDCVACTDPAVLPALLAAERAQLDTEAERARAHRAAGEAARQEYLTPGLPGERFAEVQARMLRELGTANAISQSVMMRRAHLERVEEAHPRRTEPVTVRGAVL